ncbi:MAG: arginase family protein [Candidatus Pacearchaeota archaeon]|nr:arginase family protein [Candidatus Pacearchaeota archaeon]
MYSNEEGKQINTKLLDLEEIHLDNSDLEMTNDLIYKNAAKIFSSKPRAIFLGGDHSITYSLTRAFLDHCKDESRKPYLIIFDAHPDCMEAPGSPNRVFPTHEDWLRSLIESGFPVSNILLIAARNSDESEISFLKKNKIKSISMNQLLEDLEGVCDAITEFSSGNELYVSIDIDVIDPAFAPGTGYIEPGGLTSREFIYILQRINRIKCLRAVDLVEINPTKDKENLTVRLGAKILSELI